MAKRGKKTGFRGVFRLDDGRWLIHATKRINGQKRYTQRILPAAFPIVEAALARQAMLEELAAGGDTEAPLRPTTVADWAERWTAGRVARLKPSSRNRYEIALGDHVLPFLGEIPMADLCRNDVERWVAHVERKLKPDSDERYAHETLGGWWRVFTEFVRDVSADLGLPDPTARVRPPSGDRTPRREKETLSPDGLRSLLETVRDSFPEWHAETFVLALSGMRPGELYALHWEHVDEERGCIHVVRSHWRGEEGSVKGDVGRRVALPSEMAAVLREHRQRQIRDQHPGLESGLVFPASKQRIGKRYGWRRLPGALAKVLGQASEIAELPIRVTPLVLRRTFNTLLSDAGVAGVVLRAQMGHSSKRMTQRYAGVRMERKTAAVDLLLDMLEED